MKKAISAIAVALSATAMFTSCTMFSSAYKDGTYKVEAKEFDDHGWKEYANVTVSDGKVSAVEFDAISQEDGHKKTEDAAYKDAYTGAGYETYPADYTEKLEKSFVEKQKAGEVDMVAGATNSSKNFKMMMGDLEGKMKKGETETIYVTLPKE